MGVTWHGPSMWEEIYLIYTAMVYTARLYTVYAQWSKMSRTDDTTLQ